MFRVPLEMINTGRPQLHRIAYCPRRDASPSATIENAAPTSGSVRSRSTCAHRNTAEPEPTVICSELEVWQSGVPIGAFEASPALSLVDTSALAAASAGKQQVLHFESWQDWYSTRPAASMDSTMFPVTPPDSELAAYCRTADLATSQLLPHPGAHAATRMNASSARNRIAQQCLKRRTTANRRIR